MAKVSKTCHLLTVGFLVQNAFLPPLQDPAPSNSDIWGPYPIHLRSITIDWLEGSSTDQLACYIYIHNIIYIYIYICRNNVFAQRCSFRKYSKDPPTVRLSLCRCFLVAGVCDLLTTQAKSKGNWACWKHSVLTVQTILKNTRHEIWRNPRL